MSSNLRLRARDMSIMIDITRRLNIEMYSIDKYKNGVEVIWLKNGDSYMWRSVDWCIGYVELKEKDGFGIFDLRINQL